MNQLRRITNQAGGSIKRLLKIFEHASHLVHDIQELEDAGKELSASSKQLHADARQFKKGDISPNGFLECVEHHLMHVDTFCRPFDPKEDNK